MKPLSLYVLISTIDNGIHQVPEVLLPPEDGVFYVVSWQQTTPSQYVAPPQELTGRKDVVISPLEGRGLCRNRNHAIEVAISLQEDALEDAVFIIADDDERIEKDAFKNIRELYSRYPKLDVSLFRMKDIDNGCLLKRYPKTMTSFALCPRYYYPSSVEMTFRSRLSLMGIRFDERFGIGSEKLAAGEEDVFLTDALRHGLQVWICPHVLCSTKAQTTGSRVLDKKVLRSKGAVYGYRLPLIKAFFRSCREALSLAVRNRQSFFLIFRNIWYGVKYIRR